MLEYADKARYTGKIINQGLSKLGQKDTPCALIEFIVTGRITGPDLVEPVSNNYKRTVTIWLTENTIEYATRDLDTLGFSNWWTLDQLNLDHAECIDLRNRVAEFYCQHEINRNGDGKEYERWSVGLAGYKELELQPVDRADLRRLDALFGKGKRPAGPPPAQRSTQSQPTKLRSEDVGITDEDVPF